eukprot:TRINITY_DN6017_c0_g1_i1.p1 TRINITY_DN6017_c0_g1~~TRINITY_DN6017_c0_g1_i1.p1  ORF type:complete len:316 (+),score=106.94 TRINITY_DN6017_c0_g1_i1:55-948(+)
MATYFDDIDKSSNDLFKKGFPVNGSFKVTSEFASDDASVVASAERTVSKGADKVTATIEPKFTFKDYNIEFTPKLTTNQNNSFSLNLKNYLGESSKFALGVVTTKAGAAGNSFTAGYEIKTANVAAKVGLTFPDDSEENPVKASANVGTVYEGVTVGASANFTSSYDDGESHDGVTAFAGKIGYGGAVIKYESGDDAKCTASYFKQNDDIKLAGKFDYNTVSHKSAVAFGADWKYAADTTIKSKLSVAGDNFRSGFSLSQQYTPAATVTIAADLNNLALLGSNSGAAHSFGVEVKFA